MSPEISITTSDGLVTVVEQEQAGPFLRAESASPGHSRPGTPPAAHVSPRRERLPGLPPSPTRHADSRSSSRLSCALEMIPALESPDELDAEIEAFHRFYIQKVQPAGRGCSPFTRSPELEFGPSRSPHQVICAPPRSTVQVIHASTSSSHVREGTINTNQAGASHANEEKIYENQVTLSHSNMFDNYENLSYISNQNNDVRIYENLTITRDVDHAPTIYVNQTSIRHADGPDPIYANQASVRGADEASATYANIANTSHACISGPIYANLSNRSLASHADACRPSTSSCSPTDPVYLVPSKPRGPGEVMPPSTSLDRLPMLMPSDSGPPVKLHGILKNATTSTTTLNYDPAPRTDNVPLETLSHPSADILVVQSRSAPSIAPAHAILLTPTRERLRAPCPQSLPQIHQPHRTPSQLCGSVRNLSLPPPQPSTSYEPTPSCSYDYESRQLNYSPSQIRTTASGLLEDISPPALIDDLNLATAHSPPASPASPPAPPAPPAQFANIYEGDRTLRKRRFSFFRRMSSRNRATEEARTCRYHQHSNAEMEATRPINIAALSRFTLEACECLKACPKLLALLEMYKEYILRVYRAGPYFDTSDRAQAAPSMELVARPFALAVENIGERDWCLSVSYTQGCGINENSLIRFSMYDGFKGFKVCGTEAFIIYTNEESALQAMQNVNGLLLYLEHAFEVSATTPHRVRQIASSQTYRRYRRYDDMALSLFVRGEYGDFAEEDGGDEEARRRGGLRRRGDERRLPANRRLTRRRDAS